jgi:phosphatidylserine/phosphatidylglycerophosphate/cardiolipin synthase-like enzyme
LHNTLLPEWKCNCHWVGKLAVAHQGKTDVPGAVNRDTSVVIRDLFANAKQTVLVAGYAVYQGHKVFQALAERMLEIPSLSVRLFLDIQRPHGDRTSSAELIRRFAARFRQSQWPRDCTLPEIYFDPRSLETEADKRASLHAKTVVVDSRYLFVSSANFTEAANLRNIEVGVAIDSPPWHNSYPAFSMCYSQGAICFRSRIRNDS